MAASLSNREARRLAIAAQGLDRPRGNGRARPARAALLGLLDRIGAIQLDAVNVLERSQFLVAFSRLGPYDRTTLRALTGAGAPWFEYWGHAASLLPVASYPLFRSRMERFSQDGPGSSVYQQRRHAWRRENASYLAAVLEEVRARGPLAASQLSDPRRQAGSWWDRRSLGRRALELLFGEGALTAWRSASFERVYDLAERVIAPEVLAAPVPGHEEAERELVAAAARCLGVATATDLAAYFSLSVPSARFRIAELVEAGRLQTVSVEGWSKPAYVAGDPRPKAPRRVGATILSPFDSLVWTRDRTERLFDFRYRIGIYTPAAQRTDGYFVLPLLLGDRLVARFDLKSDRRQGVLVVKSANAEEGTDRAEVAGAAAVELRALAQWLELDAVSVGTAGSLAAVLRRAVKSSAG